uniref:LigA n=1 Tax=Parastrongyloides trichosuri TaxID=131310 RepID=A0A0N4ZXV0_PARTI
MRIDKGEAVLDHPADPDLPARRGDRRTDTQTGDLLLGDIAEVTTEGRVRQAGVEAVADIIDLAGHIARTVAVAGVDRVTQRADVVAGILLEVDGCGVGGRAIAGVAAAIEARLPDQSERKAKPVPTRAEPTRRPEVHQFDAEIGAPLGAESIRRVGADRVGITNGVRPAHAIGAAQRRHPVDVESVSIGPRKHPRRLVLSRRIAQGREVFGRIVCGDRPSVVGFTHEDEMVKGGGIGVACARVPVAACSVQLQPGAVVQNELRLRRQRLHALGGLQSCTQSGPVDERLAPIAGEGQLPVRVVGRADELVVGDAQIGSVLVVARLQIDIVQIGAIGHLLDAAGVAANLQLDVVGTDLQWQIAQIILAWIQAEFAHGRRHCGARGPWRLPAASADAHRSGDHCGSFQSADAGAARRRRPFPQSPDGRAVRGPDRPGTNDENPWVGHRPGAHSDARSHTCR